MPAPRRLKAFSYIRFSTPEQAKGDSLARQLRLSQEYASTHGLELDESLSMRDLGLSGYNKANITKGALGEFIAAVENGLVPKGSLLLVESLDRISRAEITEQMTLFLSLINRGITIVTLGDGMKYSKETIDRQMSELVISLVYMSRGHEESATKSRRLKSAWASKRARGDKHILTSLCPAWLKVDKTAEAFVQIAERCKVVRLIFQWAESGIGKGVIAKRLNGEAVPVFGRGNGWHSSYVQKILQNRAVLGEFQPHRMQDGKRVPEGDAMRDYFPRIVSDEVFFRTLNRRSASAKVTGRARSSSANLFSGLLKCGYTSGSVVYVNKGKWQYLVTDDARRGLGGAYMSWPYKDFETSFFAFLKELSFADLLDDEWKAKRDEADAKLTREKEEKAALKLQVQRLVDAITEGNAPKAVIERMNRIEAQLATKEREIAQLAEMAEELRRMGEDAVAVERKAATLLSRRNEPEAREQLRQELLRQVERISVFAGGPRAGGSGLGDWMFNGVPNFSTPSIDVAQWEETVVEALNERLRHAPSPDIPSDRSRRYFKVHFKTGAVKHVMPDASDPTKFQKVAWMPEAKGGLPTVRVQTPNGFSVALYFDDKKQIRKKQLP